MSLLGRSALLTRVESIHPSLGSGCRNRGGGEATRVLSHRLLTGAWLDHTSTVAIRTSHSPVHSRIIRMKLSSLLLHMVLRC